VSESPKVYAAIVGVIRDIGADGIAKARSNQQQGYKFRGIDDVYNALSPILAANNLCMLPRVKSRTMTEGTTKSGGVLFYVVVDVDFDLVCSLDGSKHTISTAGEAMDSADKATNKAMSAAYKYAAMMAFAIPTEGDNDADAHTPAPVARVERPAQARQELSKAPPTPAATSATPERTRWPDAARVAFCAELGKLGINYDDCAEWCESLGRPRPSTMTPDERSKLIAALLTPATLAKLQKFIASKE